MNTTTIPTRNFWMTWRDIVLHPKSFFSDPQFEQSAFPPLRFVTRIAYLFWLIAIAMNWKELHALANGAASSAKTTTYVAIIFFGSALIWGPLIRFFVRLQSLISYGLFRAFRTEKLQYKTVLAITCYAWSISLFAFVPSVGQYLSIAANSLLIAAAYIYNRHMSWKIVTAVIALTLAIEYGVYTGAYELLSYARSAII